MSSSMSHPMPNDLTGPSAHRFPPLAPQDPLHMVGRNLTRGLPQISLPWLEIGLAVMLIVALRLG